MLPKLNRLTAKEIYNLKSTSVTKAYSKHLGVFGVSNDTYLKVGIVISKKQLSKAVDRNRVKRQLYHLLRTLIPLESKWTLLVLPKASFSVLSTEEQIQEISQLLKQLRVISSR